MQIEFKNGPTINSPSNAKAIDRREAAIAKLLGNTSAETSAKTSAPTDLPVKNATSISPEETSAVIPQSTESEGQTTTSEATSPEDAPKEATESKSTEEPLSKQYAIIARKEKALRAKMQEVKAKELDIATREQALQSQPKASIDESKFISLEKLQADPISTLLRAGINYEQITQLMLNQPQVDPATKFMLDEMKAEIKRLNDAQENSNKKYSDQQSNQYKQAVNQIKNEATALVSNDPAFEMIKETGSVSDVVQLIEDTFKADGILLSVEDAAREVEEYLVEQAAKFSKLKKIQQKLAPPKQEAPKSQDPKQQQQMKTLTNAVGTSRQLSAKERAILAFKGELSK